jgi:hypothetical protein
LKESLGRDHGGLCRLPWIPGSGSILIPSTLHRNRHSVLTKGCSLPAETSIERGKDELQHSPNEFFRLSGYERGQKAYGMLLDKFGK